MAGRARNIVQAEIKVLEVVQGEQGGTYLTGQSRRVPGIKKLRIIVAKLNREDMAGLVAAPDACPPAAVFIAFVP
jgi:hypothetical protein